jgi:hypothetical protein
MNELKKQNISFHLIQNSHVMSSHLYSPSHHCLVHPMCAKALKELIPHFPFCRIESVGQSLERSDQFGSERRQRRRLQNHPEQALRPMTHKRAFAILFVFRSKMRQEAFDKHSGQILQSYFLRILFRQRETRTTQNSFVLPLPARETTAASTILLSLAPLFARQTDQV